MQELPVALHGLGSWNQFIVWQSIPTGRGKPRKVPTDPGTLLACDPHKPENWLTAGAAMRMANLLGAAFGTGFVLTPNDPFFFVDIDNCLSGQAWSSLALEILGRFPGAAVEVSYSGDGLHVLAQGRSPEHGCKNVPLKLEFYTEGRFVALTGDRAMGDVCLDLSAALPAFVGAYFPVAAPGTEPLQSGPVADWTGPTDDTELIKKALASSSGGSAFGDTASFRDLWEANSESLCRAYPAQLGSAWPWDASSADAALAQHLAFWTGRDMERMSRLMLQSALRRDKWEREDYLPRTVQFAARIQQDVYSVGAQNPEGTTLAEAHGAIKLRASSEAQREYAERVRADKLTECAGDVELITRLCQEVRTAKLWLDHQDRTPQEIGDMIAKIEQVSRPTTTSRISPVTVSGYQYLDQTRQLEFFQGCVYIRDEHKILTPWGERLKPEAFNVAYGGFTFQIDDTGSKVTRSAWEAFTNSQVIRQPQVTRAIFRPPLEFGTIYHEEGISKVNIYKAIDTPSVEGDAGPFLRHLESLIPNERDRQILLAYMAAVVQYPGVKFQWAPLIQGVEGNGKTFFSWCVAAAVGDRYSHFPSADNIAEKYNKWLFENIFIAVEDIYVPGHKQEILETLKPMVTNRRMEMRAMQSDKVMKENVANFIFNSNHRDAIRKSLNDRRFAIFYSAQQSFQDLSRDGLTNEYFHALYQWVNSGGHAVITFYLKNYPIADEFNPAGVCNRAPVTTSTDHAVTESLGFVEQEIIEALEEGVSGMCGGWVSSVALHKVLTRARLDRVVPPIRRRAILQGMGYDYHTFLPDGRANTPVVIDDQKKPRLFVHKDNPDAKLTEPKDIVKAYEAAQSASRFDNDSLPVPPPPTGTVKLH